MTLRDILNFILDFPLQWLLAIPVVVALMMAVFAVISKIFEAIKASTPTEVKKELSVYSKFPLWWKYFVLIGAIWGVFLLVALINYLTNLLRNLTA